MDLELQIVLAIYTACVVACGIVALVFLRVPRRLPWNRQ
jgi:hypothetical protein